MARWKQHASSVTASRATMQADSQQQHNLSSAATSLSPNAGHARRKRYKCRYKTEWMEQWPFILPVPHDPHRFFCSVCCREVSCSHQGKRDVERHVSLMMHANNAVLQFEQVRSGATKSWGLFLRILKTVELFRSNFLSLLALALHGLQTDCIIWSTVFQFENLYSRMEQKKVFLFVAWVGWWTDQRKSTDVLVIKWVASILVRFESGMMRQGCLFRAKSWSEMNCFNLHISRSMLMKNCNRVTCGEALRI